MANIVGVCGERWKIEDEAPSAMDASSFIFNSDTPSSGPLLAEQRQISIIQRNEAEIVHWLIPLKDRHIDSQPIWLHAAGFHDGVGVEPDGLDAIGKIMVDLIIVDDLQRMGFFRGILRGLQAIDKTLKCLGIIARGSG